MSNIYMVEHRYFNPLASGFNLYNKKITYLYYLLCDNLDNWRYLCTWVLKAICLNYRCYTFEIIYSIVPNIHLLCKINKTDYHLVNCIQFCVRSTKDLGHYIINTLILVSQPRFLSIPFWHHPYICKQYVWTDNIGW